MNMLKYQDYIENILIKTNANSINNNDNDNQKNEYI